MSILQRIFGRSHPGLEMEIVGLSPVQFTLKRYAITIGARTVEKTFTEAELEEFLKIARRQYQDPALVTELP